MRPITALPVFCPPHGKTLFCGLSPPALRALYGWCAAAGAQSSDIPLPGSRSRHSRNEYSFDRYARRVPPGQRSRAPATEARRRPWGVLSDEARRGVEGVEGYSVLHSLVCPSVGKTSISHLPSIQDWRDDAIDKGWAGAGGKTLPHHFVQCPCLTPLLQSAHFGCLIQADPARTWYREKIGAAARGAQ